MMERSMAYNKRHQFRFQLFYKQMAHPPPGWKTQSLRFRKYFALLQIQSVYNGTQVWLHESIWHILMDVLILTPSFNSGSRCECHFPIHLWGKSLLICMFVCVRAWQRGLKNVTVSESFNPWLRSSWLYTELRLNSCLFLEATTRKEGGETRGVKRKR